MGDVNPESLSIRHLVGIADEEGSAAMMWRQGGHPEATGSNRFESMSLAASMVSIVASRPPFLFFAFHLQTAGMAYLG